jgi:hypothetical protein
MTISGGTVSLTAGRAIHNDSRCVLTISGGRVEATTGVAIWSAFLGSGSPTVVITSGTVTSANTDANAGTIVLRETSVSTSTEMIRLRIEGGLVSNTGVNGRVINHQCSERIIISGGRVEASTGTSHAIFAQTQTTPLPAGIGRGRIEVSGNAVVTAAGSSAAIHIQNTGLTDRFTRLAITGGTVSNTGTGRAIQFNSNRDLMTINGTPTSTVISSAANDAIAFINTDLSADPRIWVYGGSISAPNGRGIFLDVNRAVAFINNGLNNEFAIVTASSPANRIVLKVDPGNANVVNLVIERIDSLTTGIFGTSNGLTWLPTSGSTVTWGSDTGGPFIRYRRDSGPNINNGEIDVKPMAGF